MRCADRRGASVFGNPFVFGNRGTVPKPLLWPQISTTSVSRSNADRVEKMSELRGREIEKGNRDRRYDGSDSRAGDAAAAAARRQRTADQLAICRGRRNLSLAGAAGVRALVLQQGWRRARGGRRLCLRRLRHEPLLPPPAHASQLQMSALARTCVRASRGLVLGGYAGALGRNPSHASSSFGRTSRSAQPAGQFLLVAHGLAVSGKH